MAITWGNTVGSNNGFAIGIEYLTTVYDTYVSVAANVYMYNANNVSDVNNTGSWGSNWYSTSSGSESLNISGSGTHLISSFPAVNVNRTYGSDQTPYLTYQLYGLEYFNYNSTASVTAYVTIPARAWSLPAAPTNPAASRVSDTEASATWTNNQTSTAPYENVYLYRSTDGGAFVQIAKLAGTATGYTDTTVTSNHSYVYQPRSWNSNGYSSPATASAIYTTPAAPTIGAATKTGATAVTTTATDNSNTETAFEWQKTTDGGTTQTSAGSTAANTPTLVDTSAPSGTVAYRARATRGTLVSAWSTWSNTITTIAPPAAPTPTAWGAYSPTGSALRFAWQHNSLDGSAQSSANVVYNIGSGDVTITVSGATAYYDIPITGKAAGTAVTAKVRTYGLHANPSAYSSLSSTTLANPPQINITAPATDGATVINVPLGVAWSYTDTFAQAGWSLTLSKDGDAIATWTGTTETTCSIAASYLLNLTAYALSLSVRSGSGFIVVATRSFTVNYAGPTVPVVSAAFDAETLSTNVSAYAGALGSNPATASLALLRIDSYDGVNETVVLANPLTAGSTIVDRVPRLGQGVTYRVMAMASNGAYSVTDAVVSTISAPMYYAWNFDTGKSQLAKLSATPQASDSPRIEKKIVQYAGREKPVAYYGKHKTNTPKRSGNVWESADITAFHELSLYAGDAIFRDPYGLRIYASCDVDLSEGAGPRDVAVSVAMQEVDG